MTSDHDALYQTICENPAEDTPRLVFADWLQEHDEEDRAEFIRTQCYLASASPADPEYVDLRERNEELLSAYWLRWQNEWPFLPDGQWEGWHRGFAGWMRVNTSGPEWEGAFRETPVRQFIIGDTRDWSAEWTARFPWPSWVEGLNLGSAITLWEVLSLLNARDLLTSLRRLRFWGIPTGSEDRSLMMGCMPLVSLRRLDIPGTALAMPEEALQRLLVPGLRELHLDRMPGSEWTDRLARCGPFSELHTFACPSLMPCPDFRVLSSPMMMPAVASLNLAHVEMGSPDLVALAETPWTLRDLRLRACGIDHARAGVLARLPALGSLRSLDLSHNNIRLTGLRHLVNSPHLRALRTLDLSENPIPAEGYRAVLRGKLPRLVSLLLAARSSRNRPHDEIGFAKALGEMDLPELRRLEMKALPVGGAGAEALASSAQRTDLRTLRLYYCGINTKGASALFASPHLRKLRVLDLRGNPIGSGCAPLADLSVLPDLILCDLRSTQIKDARLIARLRERPGVLV